MLISNFKSIALTDTTKIKHFWFFLIVSEQINGLIIFSFGGKCLMILHINVKILFVHS